MHLKYQYLIFNIISKYFQAICDLNIAFLCIPKKLVIDMKKKKIYLHFLYLFRLFAAKLGGGTSRIAQVCNNTDRYDHLSVKINLREIIVISNNDNDVS